ncbi:MAG TPA: hypothetical protein VFX16_15220 [Pseudonocardiaceae bacterium]|nr:hypothetical protein [Pseudonocardiaceae bacterium]
MSSTRTVVLALVLMAGGGLILAGCASTPADRDHICGEYATLNDDMAADDFFDNDVFKSAGRLADLANRYQGSPNLSADGSRLRAIADSHLTDGLEVEEATGEIGELCDSSSITAAGSGPSNLGGSPDVPDTQGTDTATDEPVPDSSAWGIPQPTDEASALAALRQTSAQDQPAVDDLAGQWVPQLSSKTEGLVADGITYDDLAIWQQYQQLVTRYPQALLLWSGDYSTFARTDFWVVIMPDGEAGAAAANSWCDSQNEPVDQCYAKLISHTAGSKGSSVTR